jgi:hypothetical protein|tara:strand:- start:287 stop:469 length:183 start_codon:yes stop_codon:yes gene_type:complete
MEEIELLDKVKKVISNRESQIQETLMSGGLIDMEHYKYLQGELSSLYYVLTELKEFYKDK